MWSSQHHRENQCDRAIKLKKKKKREKKREISQKHTTVFTTWQVKENSGKTVFQEWMQNESDSVYKGFRNSLFYFCPIFGFCPMKSW